LLCSTSQFAINGSKTSKGHLAMSFGRGGFGGNAAADSCGGWWLDNVVSRQYRWHLGCILLTMAAISLLTGGRA